MKSDAVGCLVYPCPRGRRYLTGFDSFNFGQTLLPYFADSPSMAFPMTRKQADYALSLIDFDIRKRLEFAKYPNIDFEPDIFSLEYSLISNSEV